MVKTEITILDEKAISTFPLDLPGQELNVCRKKYQNKSQSNTHTKPKKKKQQGKPFLIIHLLNYLSFGIVWCVILLSISKIIILKSNIKRRKVSYGQGYLPRIIASSVTIKLCLQKFELKTDKDFQKFFKAFGKFFPTDNLKYIKIHLKKVLQCMRWRFFIQFVKTTRHIFPVKLEVSILSGCYWNR